jgi:hypothetical protein
LPPGEAVRRLSYQALGVRLTDGWPITCDSLVVTLAHEMGHAWGNLHDRRTARDQTAREAMTWENTARDKRYGISTVHRVKHQ